MWNQREGEKWVERDRDLTLTLFFLNSVTSTRILYKFVSRILPLYFFFASPKDESVRGGKGREQFVKHQSGIVLPTFRKSAWSSKDCKLLINSLSHLWKLKPPGVGLGG